MKTARILYLAHRLPYPPNKGDKIRSCHEWQALARDHDVTVAAFVDDPADWKLLPEVQDACHRLVALPLRPSRARLRSLLALLSSQPLSLAYYGSGRMRRALRELSEGGPFDAVVAFSSTMAPYALAVPATRRILDLCDLDSEKWAQFAETTRFPMSAVYRIEARRLGRYEAAAALRFDETLLVSEAEAETLRERAPGAAVRVVPNGVDLDHLDPAACDVAPDGRTLVFCGAMDYRSNIDAVLWFHDEILPLVRREQPDARLKIVGSSPAPEVRALERTPGVRVTGRVEDVRPELLSSAVSIAPLRLGRGVPNKVLEALALALPLVCTSNAAAGLDLSGFAGVEVADEPAEFAAAAVRRLRAPARLPGNRALLRERYGWEHHLGVFRQIVLPDR